MGPRGLYVGLELLCRVNIGTRIPEVAPPRVYGCLYLRGYISALLIRRIRHGDDTRSEQVFFGPNAVGFKTLALLLFWGGDKGTRMDVDRGLESIARPVTVHSKRGKSTSGGILDRGAGIKKYDIDNVYTAQSPYTALPHVDKQSPSQSSHRCPPDNPGCAPIRPRYIFSVDIHGGYLQRELWAAKCTFIPTYISEKKYLEISEVSSRFSKKTQGTQGALGCLRAARASGQPGSFARSVEEVTLFIVPRAVWNHPRASEDYIRDP
ncbi:hypothetical protein BJ912DRAFT_1047589 [Pholiota molesta]|nr:hypothetical protein BJ912DRAFT_1047589 [Pholiota molesta]